MTPATSGPHDVTDAARKAAACFAARVRDVRRLGTGLINDTFSVATPDGDLVLQRLNAGVFPDVDGLARNVAVVVGHLRRTGRGGLVPEPVATLGDEPLARVCGGVWRAWRRVPGAAPAGLLTPAVVCSAGVLLGRFHAGVADLDPSRLTVTLPGFHDPARRLGALRAAVGADRCGRVSSAGAEIAAVWRAAPLVDTAARLTAAVPRRVAHFDAKLDNFLFRGDEAICLVDLDTLMPGAWFWDVGDLLRSATAAEDDPDPPGPVVGAERGAAALDGYRDGLGGAATAAEAGALAVCGSIVAFEQAVRFLTDWLSGDVYYRTTRPGQNLDRARNQLAVLASMPGPEPAAGPAPGRRTF